MQKGNIGVTTENIFPVFIPANVGAQYSTNAFFIIVDLVSIR